jgi:inner membrane protein
MDNVTHTLIGVLLGACASELTASVKSSLSREERRVTLMTTMAIGSNLPDADLLYSIFDPGKLGYLLEHRGYTHTIVGAFAGALLLWAACELLWRQQHRSPLWTDRVTIFTAVFSAALIHIAMDFTNSYGVHPFWPLDNHWYYGDAVFIAEPLIWAALTPLLFVFKSRIARGFLLLVLIAGFSLAFFAHEETWIAPTAVAALCIALFLVARKASAPRALSASVLAWVCVTAVFAFSTHTASRRVSVLMAAFAPEESLEDVILTPSPANPICWEAIVVTATPDRYRLRRAVMSLAERWIPAQSCRAVTMQSATTAPLTPVSFRATTAISWWGQYEFPRDEFRQIVRSRCEAAQLLRFARAPFFAHDGAALIAGDLRYDREAALGFAELQLSNLPCTRHTPPWIPPRASLLDNP